MRQELFLFVYICVLFFIHTYINYKGGSPITVAVHGGMVSEIVTAIKHTVSLHRLNLHVRQFTNKTKGRMN